MASNTTKTGDIIQPSTVEVLSWINQDLVNTINWFLANKLIFNVTKTEHMFLGTSFRLCNLGMTIPVTLGDRKIKRVKQTKYLGIYLDENLKWDQHIDKVCTGISRSISGLRQASSILCFSRCTENNVWCLNPACL